MGSDAGAAWKKPGGYSSGQRGQTVNLLTYVFTGSNPVPPTALTVARRAKVSKLSVARKAKVSKLSIARKAKVSKLAVTERRK